MTEGEKIELLLLLWLETLVTAKRMLGSVADKSMEVGSAQSHFSVALA